MDTFKDAWALARQGARRFGGRPVTFFRCALAIVLVERRRSVRPLERVVAALVTVVTVTIYNSTRDTVRWAGGRNVRQTWFNLTVKPVQSRAARPYGQCVAQAERGPRPLRTMRQVAQGALQGVLGWLARRREDYRG